MNNVSFQHRLQVEFMLKKKIATQILSAGLLRKCS